MSEQTHKDLTPRRLFSDLDPFADFFNTPMPWRRGARSPFAAEGNATWAPAMDVVERPDGYTVSLELAGASKDDVTVECHDNVLTIKGEKRSEREEEKEHHHYRERTYGSFSRSIRLPTDASDDLNAKFKDGVLTVEIPKIEERKPRTVSIGED